VLHQKSFKLHFKESRMPAKVAKVDPSAAVREVMDIRQASDYLGISPDSLYKYASESTVPAFKLGNRWRFKRTLLDAWMDRQSQQPVVVRPRDKKPASRASAR
jgi:excisionase family DNA binding protein